MKPIIGVVSRPSLSIKKNKCHVLDENIKNAIVACGGIPLLISPPQIATFYDVKSSDIPKLSVDNKNDLNKLIDMCDGILCPGGDRVYEYDYYICEYAKSKNIPILGICAGMQLMSRIDSDNYNEKLSDINHYLDDNSTHEVKIIKNTLLYKILNTDSIQVNSYHNYKVHDSGTNLVCATSLDGVIEAIENPKYKFYLGIQWHPELLMDDNSKKILKYFINISKK